MILRWYDDIYKTNCMDCGTEILYGALSTYKQRAVPICSACTRRWFWVPDDPEAEKA